MLLANTDPQNTIFFTVSKGLNATSRKRSRFFIAHENPFIVYSETVAAFTDSPENFLEKSVYKV